MSESNSFSIGVSGIVQVMNALPLFIPGIAMMVSIFFSIKLFSRLKPGLVCDFSDQCDRCDLLYGLSIGVFVFSFIFIIKEISLYAQIYYDDKLMSRTSDMQVLVSSFMRSAIFLFFSWLCFKGKMCMHSNYLYKSEKTKKIKTNTRSSNISSGVFIGGAVVCSNSCEPVYNSSFRDIQEIDKWKHVSKKNDNLPVSVKRKTCDHDMTVH